MDKKLISDYQSIRHPNVRDLSITSCYLCNKPLNSDNNPDHIIPTHLFISGDPHRPQLPAHQKCNKQKSKDDQWFVRQLQLNTAYNKEAYNEFSNFLDKAKEEVPNAYIIGKRPRNLVLAKKIFENGIWGLEIESGGQRYVQFKPAPENTKRFSLYIENMCRGLFLRNIKLSNPEKPELIIRQYEDLKIRGKYDGFRESIQNFINGSRDSIFGQRWGNRILYLGSRVAETPNKGYIFVEFQKQIGILGVFR